MSKRKRFLYNDPDVDIYLHPDGTLTIETRAPYSDSETGWGEASTTVSLESEEVTKFVEFLGGTTRDRFQWRRVNSEPFEYAIQQGPQGDEFVKSHDGTCLRRPIDRPADSDKRNET